MGDSLLWPASFWSSGQNTILAMQMRLFIPAKLSTVLTSLRMILRMHLLEKHKQYFLWSSIPGLTALSPPLDYSGPLGLPETEFLKTHRRLSRFWSSLGITSILCCSVLWRHVVQGHMSEMPETGTFATSDLQFCRLTIRNFRYLKS